MALICLGCVTHVMTSKKSLYSLSDSVFQLWNFIAILCFLGLGVKTIWIWHAGKSDDTINSSVDYANNYPSGLALGALR